MTEYVKLAAQGVCKKIHGKMILDHLNLEKTMVFRALSGLMHIDDGLVTFNGGKLHEDFSVLPSLGIVLENAGLYPNLTGMQNLAYLAGFRKLIGCEDIRQLILEEKTRGALILVASHNKDDIRLLADQIYRVENGHVFALEGGTH